MRPSHCYSLPLNRYYTASAHTGYTSRSEGYAYDGFGRLSGTSSFSGTSTTAGTVNVEDGITYDAVGNILTLSRKGVGGTVTDNMSMTYTGSRLTSVTDSGTSWTNQYAADGSLKKDGRTGIYYADNLLGFVAQVAEEDAMSVSGYSVTASYVYLADGTKYKAQTSGGSALLYRGSFTYFQSGSAISLESVSVPEGRVFVSGSTWTPYAYVTDHRGDVREIVDLGAGTVVERNDYYSYGTRITKPYSSAADFPQLSSNRWRLSGKEEQASVTGIGSLDFGARHYDPFVARWLSPDPLMEKYYGMSPYLYCAGNPVNLVDPDGNKIAVFADKGIYEWLEKDGEWGFYDANGEVYTGSSHYILALTDAIRELMYGEIGASMVKEIAGNRNETVMIGENKDHKNKYYPNLKQIAWSQSNSEIGPSFLSLGHEMAHAMDDLRGTMNESVWIPHSLSWGLDKDVQYNEIFAMHIENQIRREHGYPLRESYLSGEDEFYLTLSRVVNTEGYSLYYNTQGKTNYNYVLPSQRYIYNTISK